ncbi:helix-turn-helix transcriptional regulator [Nocardia jinanensis]|uniref:Transcriptional regulator n=1 Tax=Nocardia jinanensis TaxID=382504 RepID=A0A917VNY8_9NOCA|nr:helix-turn-helix transcriptional regulator [Nocardia jinanensis]GGL00056.1 transcriptional regulator [Nocardia jinanensis]
MARNAFAEYLVRRRAELRPGDIGLPAGGRRRTPGLRREEVAVRAGVSADYLARLEQGRDTNPSIAVVEALATALLLDERERSTFGWLALTSTHEARCPETTDESEHVPETIETVLRALAPTSAFVLGRRLNVLGWNAAWEDFVTPLGLLDNRDEVNLARYVYQHPMARKVLRNWTEAADTFAETLRRASLRWPGDAGLRETIDALHKTPEFAARWRPQGAGRPVTPTLRFDHPGLGAVDVPFESLESDREQSVVVWLVARAPESAQALRLVPPRAAGQ